jgi:hypothetical protein
MRLDTVAMRPADVCVMPSPDTHPLRAMQASDTGATLVAIVDMR